MRESNHTTLFRGNKASCEKCGLCCCAFTDIQLSFKEVVSGRYRTQLSNNPERDNEKILFRRQQWVPFFNMMIYCCVYFDARARACRIYNYRPEVCRAFNCKDWRDSNDRRRRFPSVIRLLKSGKNPLYYESGR